MHHYLKYLILLGSFLSMTTTMAKPLRLKKVLYEAKGGESLIRVLMFNYKVSPKTLRAGLAKKILKINPKVKNYKKLKTGEKVILLIPITSNTNVKSKKKAATNSKKVESKIKGSKSSWNFSLFYAYSRGSLKENTLDNSNSATLSQNSNLTLGAAGFKRISQELSFSTSIYYSQFNNVTNVNGVTVGIPAELGINSYLGYNANLIFPSDFYAGFDYESLSSFNTDEQVFGASLETRTHGLLYATLGISQYFKIINLNTLIKMSISQTVSSSQSRPSTVNPEPFTGNKFLIYFNIKITKHWFLSALYKQHNLSGPTKLIISRTGLGFGYAF